MHIELAIIISSRPLANQNNHHKQARPLPAGHKQAKADIGSPSSSRYRLGFEHSYKLVDRNDFAFVAAQHPDRYGARCRLALADDDHVRHLGDFGLADLEAELLVADIGGDAIALGGDPGLQA